MKNPISKAKLKATIKRRENRAIRKAAANTTSTKIKDS